MPWHQNRNLKERSYISMVADSETLITLTARLSKRMDTEYGRGGKVNTLHRLSGGANMETWSFNWGKEGFILRRMVSVNSNIDRLYGCHLEAQLVRAACAHGIIAPEVMFELQPEDELGDGYVMRRVGGTTDPQMILPSAGPNLLFELTLELSKIHAMPVNCVAGLPTMSIKEIVNNLQSQFKRYGADRPVTALGLQWLESHLPIESETTLLHGDFRMGNVMVDRGHLAAVLDWERVHIGDPYDDLAYGCMAVWRFGRVEKPAYGLGTIEEFLSIYEQASGRLIDRARFRFWLVLRTIWWTLGCIRMGTLWRNRADRALERVVIGRRAVENELDLLFLLEQDAPQIEQRRSIRKLDDNSTEACLGEPTDAELVQAVREWVEADVKPGMAGRAKFQTLVALNALGIVQRNLTHRVDIRDSVLSKAITTGEVSLRTPKLLVKLKGSTVQKLQNDSPKYASLKIAQAKWFDPSN